MAAQTFIRKITVGTPVRKVTGAQAQALGDLTDVNIPEYVPYNLLQLSPETGKYETTTEPDGLTIAGGGAASINNPGADF